MKRVVALFVKPPVPGRVKTRLAREIGDEAACRLYRRVAEKSIRQVAGSGFPLTLFYDGVSSDNLPGFWCASARSCLPQEGDDLGERMVAAFAMLFSQGAEQAVLIGSDIPGIDSSYLQAAHELLAPSAMVIGPAIDGGYCLIGFHRQSFRAALFENIPWSTERVLERTLAAASTAVLPVKILPPLRDIDTLDDLRALLDSEKKDVSGWKQIKS